MAQQRGSASSAREVEQGVEVCSLLLPQRHGGASLRQLSKVHVSIHDAGLLICNPRGSAEGASS